MDQTLPQPYKGKVFTEEEFSKTQPQSTLPAPYKGKVFSEEGFNTQQQNIKDSALPEWTSWLGVPTVDEIKARGERPLLDAMREDFIEKTPQGARVVGTWNAAKNIGQTIAAGADQLLGTELAQGIEDTIPEYTPTSGIGQVSVPLGGLAAGVQGGLAVSNAASKIPGVSSVPNAIGSIGNYLSSVIGGVASVDDKEKPLITGPEAKYAKILWGVGTDENGNFSENLLRNKLDLVIENAAIAKPLELALRGTKGGISWLADETIGRLANWKNLPVKEQQVTEDMVNAIGRIDPNASKEEQAKALEDLADAARRGGIIKIPVDVEGVDDAVVKRTTPRALIEEAGVSPEEQARLAGVEAEVIAKGAPKVEAVADSASHELDRVATETRKAFGGSKMADRSKDDIYMGIEDDIAKTSDPVAAKQFEIDRVNQDFDETLKGDSFLGKSVKDSETGRDLSISEQHNQTADDIASSHYEAQMRRKAPFKERYKAEGDRTIKINDNALNDGITKLEEFGEILTPAIKKRIAASDGSYVRFRREILPQIKQLRDELWAGANQGVKGSGEQAQRLDDFIKNQSDFQREYINKRSGGNSKLLKEMDQLDAEYASEVGQYRQGTAGKIENDTKRLFGKPDETIETNRKTVKSTFDNPDNSESTKRLLKSLPDNKKSLALDYVKGAWAERFGDRIRDNGLDGISASDMANFARTYRPMLDGENLKGLDEFIKTIDTRKISVKELTDQLKDIKISSERARKALEKKTENFLDDSGELIQKGDDVFEGYLSNQKGANQLDDLIKRADRTPEGRKGLKASFVKYMQKKVFRGGTTPSGAKNINETEIKKIREEGDKLLEFGEKVFSDNPTVIKVYDKLINEAGNAANLKGAKKISMTALNQADVQARGAIDFAVTQAFGALNRFGARIRSTAGRVIQGKTSKDLMLQARENIASNPELFAKYVDQMAEDIRKGVDPRTTRRIYDYLVMTQTLSPDEKQQLEKEIRLEDQTEQIQK